MADRGGWTALPEYPVRYRQRDRWSDSRAGRADARAGIPRVESGWAYASATFTDLAPFPEDVVTRPPVTPYLAGLRSACDCYLASELGQYEAARVQLREKLFEAQARRESLATAMELATTRLTEVSGPLTDQELNRRGPAELDEHKWPAEMLHERRKRARQLARLQAEEALREATVGLRAAELAVEHAHVALDDRFKLAQAMGWQIVHHFRQREATYLRSLARAHKSGPALVKLLELAGPELPEWLTRTDREKEGS